eukprot:CAMPEP_0197446338 /NCGR_PEP_ID=MMETSP1175-20131217/11307_1 /TAXON_ID=1003142 /ORGANISM="Triceratium dubium, Strain CCMP147" /LENGTH=396 /DNA_ID=CAMNT_0042977435 /DNA_START=42 /DNA_END=1232 /DNA_ORIENTATION=+
MGLGCEEQEGTTPRRILINAAGDLDISKIQRLLDGATSEEERRDLLAVERNEGTWGACHHQAALHAAIRGLNRRDSATDEKRRRWIEVLELLLRNGADANDVYSDYDWRGCGKSESAFQMILERGGSRDARLLKLFLESGGADPNLEQTSSVHTRRVDSIMSHTPLHTVVSYGEAIDCAIELIRAGADVNACRTERGFMAKLLLSETPLHIAARNGSVEWCSLLLSKGADVDAVQQYQEYFQSEVDEVESGSDDSDTEGHVPSVRTVRQCALHIAIKNSNPDLVRLLILYNANKYAQYIFGNERKTVEELCEETVDEETRKTLRDALGAEWSTNTHKYFPASFRDSVRTTLLTAKRQEWPIYTDNIMGLIFAYAADMKAAEMSDKKEENEEDRKPE